ncbi:MAG TPA: acetate--CoA ligase family protein [Xanthobacteraceae bacterium]|nr:acetate--CoA ligase family protein [Xanthobacteraceae bacterium]
MNAPTATSPAHALDTFFAPSSIAIIGASRDALKIPGLLLTFLRRNGFPGWIYPVNPNYPNIDGLACYASVADIKQPIDLAIIIIPARAVLDALKDCAAAGVKHAIIISSGFAEEGGDSAAMQDAIADLARKSGMRVSGPNAEGFYNELGQVAATFSPTVDVKPDAPRLLATRRRIGIVAQSGGIGFAIYNRARTLGLALSYVVSAGNEADLGAGEFFDYMVQDAATDVILLFLEGIRDPETFVAAARRAAEVGKPVIVVKVGRSSVGGRAAASHTASMAGWSAAYDAVFAKYGFIVSDDLDEAVAIAAVLTTSPLPKGDRVAVVTVSGGGGIWGADVAVAQGLDVPELSAPLQGAIRALIPSYGSPRNPIDITAQAVHSGGLQKTVDLLSQSEEVDSILLVLSLSNETRIPFKIEELKPLLDAQRKPVVFYTYTVPSQFARTELAKAGAVVLSSLLHTGVALRRAIDRARFRIAAPLDCDAKPLPSDLLAPLKKGRLSEYDSKRLLAAAGVPMPQEYLVRSRDELRDAVIRSSFPLAMKIQSADIPHKSDIGGVRLGIASGQEADRAYDDLIARAKQQRPDATLQGVLVGTMAKPGVEIIIGTLQDATFGPMVMVGLGGITTELFRDVVYRLAPVGVGEAAAMLDGLKAAPLLHGFRGSAEADVEALAVLVARVSQLAARHRDLIAEIELNPVLVHPKGEGTTVVDALVVPFANGSSNVP